MKALRTCRDCGLEALSKDDLLLFRTSSRAKYGKDNHCKTCHRKAGREYWTSGNGRNTRLSRYGITIDDYNLMYAEQNGCCKICGIHALEMTDAKSFLSVDHCHETGEVRGLLCDSCNMGLGKFYDNIDNLLSAVEYLKLSRKNRKKK